MDESSLLRYHALYQKSWTGKPKDPARTPRDTTSSPGSQSDVSSLKPKKTILNERKPIKTEALRSIPSTATRNPNSHTPPAERIKPRRPATSTKSAMPMIHVTMDPLSARRNERSIRRRPWQEKVSLASPRSEEFEMVYESYLPKEEWADFKARQYVTNPRYGQLYEVRREKPRPKSRQEPTAHWLWENKFHLWRLENSTPRRNTPARLQKVEAVSEVSGNQVVSSRTVQSSDIHRPHADLFAAYNNQTLLNQRRDLASTVIQRHARGWLVRKRLKDMKHQSLLTMGREWLSVTREYRELLIRIQTRHGVTTPTSEFSLAGMQDYLDKQQKYEQAFEKVAIDNKLPRDKLMEFLQECGHFPTEGEITAAFNTVFRGAGSRAEMVFVLDCSSSMGDRDFRDLMTFVKDVVCMLPVGEDRVRVGVVPYNSDVFQSFGLRQHASLEETMHAINQIRFQPGATRTDFGLRTMVDTFQDSRPGVQKVAVVVTDGESLYGDRTTLEAKKAADHDIAVFAVGVGENVQEEELENIARDASRVQMCSSYRTLVQLTRFVSSKLCLRGCTLCQHILPRIQLQGLYKAEAVEIIFTIFHPASLHLVPFTDTVHLRPTPHTPGTQALPLTSQTSASSKTECGDDPHMVEQASESLSVPLEKKPFPQMTSAVSTFESKSESQEEFLAVPASGIEKTDPEMMSADFVSGDEKQKVLPVEVESSRKMPGDHSVDTDNGTGSGGPIPRFIKHQQEDPDSATPSATEVTPPACGGSRTAGRPRTAVSSSTSASEVGQQVTTGKSPGTAGGSCTESTSHTSLTLSDSSLAHLLALSDEAGAESSTPPGFFGHDSSAGDSATPTANRNSAEDSCDDEENRSTATTTSPAGDEAPPSSQESVWTRGNSSSNNSGGGPLSALGSVQDARRPLTKSEALEVVWTLQPLAATGLNPPRSRWIRPLVDGEPAWALLDEDIMKSTDFKVCLGLVVKARLEREGVVTIPSYVRAGVEEVTTYEEAMEKIEHYLAQKKQNGG